MIKLIYKQLFMQNTEVSRKADGRLEEKLDALLQEKSLSDLNTEELQEIIHIASIIGHEEGFYCALDFLGALFAELISGIKQ